MTTGGLTPIVGRDAYAGWGKQTAWNTPVAPTNFWRWLDGSEYGPQSQITSEREGDTSPFIALSWKDSEVGVVRIVEYARPITAGCAIQAIMGTGSDAFTTPTKNTTLSSAVTVGATTFVSVGDLGNVGASVAHAFDAGYSSLVGEVLLVNLTSRTGTGPWTYTLVAGQAFRFAHSGGGTIITQGTHAFTRQNVYDAYTLEWSMGGHSGAAAQTFRLQDAVCTELKISGSANKPIRLEHTWYGALHKLQTASSTPTYEGLGTQTTASGAFNFNNGGSSWSVDSATTGNAATIKQFELSLKNSTDPAEFITEGINPGFFQPGNFDLTAQIVAKFNSWAQWNESYFGSQAPATGAGDSILMGQGAFAVTLALDGINSLAISLPYVTYAGPRLTPRLDGKAIDHPLQFTAQKGPGSPTNVGTITLTNAATAAY